MISSLIEAQRCGTEEIDRLTLLLAQKEADLALLNIEQACQGTGVEPNAGMERQNENSYDAKRGKSKVRKRGFGIGIGICRGKVIGNSWKELKGDRTHMGKVLIHEFVIIKKEKIDAA
ncbi:hypothetical protein HAX54_035997 [Datura stramonium]|uniref:Uncharacterized protein n=1 Tax=Datura stramonium TaxID=4076 RepID=A0ABS8VIV0_DATST|nr:hypothetical protein [Datura stramonium]